MNMGVHIHTCPICREEYLCKGDRFKPCDGIEAFECEMCHIKAAYMGQAKCSEAPCLRVVHCKGFCTVHYHMNVRRVACLTARRAS